MRTYRAAKGRPRSRRGISASGLRKIEKIINGTWPSARSKEGKHQL